ncbi:DUF309 domain-containing protein [Gloeocapsa sp. PCC 73106]|uniref:DUF309 domain-containing protein n=1 Tax=Gloeocapsa sp. PCC 73106 TaxID=102232 RepID=UPI00054FB689|nr:DUF309 domain-containing protein [Gloeocapsa sp. PCC 73106]
MIELELQRAVTQFNQREFYDCHDTLEALWIEAIEQDRAFYQGILQIAVACYHLGNQNWRGAVILLGEGNRKLQDYQPSYYNLNVTSLRSQSLYLLKQLQQIEPESIGELLVYLNNTDQDSWPKITLLES